MVKNIIELIEETLILLPKEAKKAQENLEEALRILGKNSQLPVQKFEIGNMNSIQKENVLGFLDQMIEKEKDKIKKLDQPSVNYQDTEFLFLKD